MVQYKINDLTAKHCYFRCSRPDVDGIKIFDSDDQATKHCSFKTLFILPVIMPCTKIGSGHVRLTIAIYDDFVFACALGLLLHLVPCTDMMYHVVSCCIMYWQVQHFMLEKIRITVTQSTTTAASLCNHWYKV